VYKRQVYDTRWNGVHIYVRGAEEQAWWFDMNTGGFHRQEVACYPHATCEFTDFITEATSGVLLARYNGVYLYDRFGSETIKSSLVAGPVKISPNTMAASKIMNIRATFARDTPTSTGSLKIAAGLDGQDAVNRLLNGEHQYETDLTSLEANSGMCYPAVTGHAAVFALDTDDGDLAIEEITVNLTQMGTLRNERATQIAVTGEASEFSGAYIELDNSVWAGYSEATPQVNPSEHLPEYTHFVDLSLMPASWWAEVATSDGGDIRVADGADNEVPSSLVDFSLSGSTGMLVFKMTQPTTANKVRIWVGNEEASTPQVTSTYGRHACYDDYWRLFCPNGGGLDNQTQFTTDNAETYNYADDVLGAFDPFYGAESGPYGAGATDFNQSAGFERTGWGIDGWFADQSLSSQKAWTTICAFKRTESSRISSKLLSLFGGLTQAHELSAIGNATSRSNMVTTASTSYTAQSSDIAAATNNWRHHAGTVVSDSERHAYVDGGGKGSNTDTVSPTLTNLHVPWIDYSSQGTHAMFQIHTAARSDAWIKYQADMMDQVTFWGTIGEFELKNTAPTDTLITAACPVGQVPQTEVGTWDGYVSITPEDPTGGTVTKFSHLVDLAELPAGWWARVVASGKNGLDIRATNGANVLLPLDLIEIDTAASTGLAVVRTSQAYGSPTAIRIWAGNASAITIDPCNAYGQYTAYDSDWRGFWPSGSGTDRTQFANDMTSVGSPGTVANGSEVNSTATVYNNELSTAMYASATNIVPSSNPITLMGSYKKPSGGVNDDSVLATVQDTDTKCGVLLHTRPSATPARLTNRNAFGTEFTAGNSTSITATNWNFMAGTSYGNHTRISYVGEATGSSSSSQDTVILSGMDRVTIAAEYATTPIRGMNATVALVGLHQAARGSAWLGYWGKSLDQANFWTVGSYTADPTALS